MLGYVLTGFVVLACELCGVGIITSLFYLYDKKTAQS